MEIRTLCVGYYLGSGKNTCGETNEKFVEGLQELHCNISFYCRFSHSTAAVKCRWLLYIHNDLR